MNNKKKSVIIISAGMAVLFTFTIIFNVLALTKFDNIFEKFFGSSSSYLKGQPEWWDAIDK